jgi:hypothetical protein
LTDRWTARLFNLCLTRLCTLGCISTKFSPFCQYGGHDLLRKGISGPGVAVSVLSVAGLVLIAIWGFRRRDVLA